jgi:hypothetical protein
MSIIPYAGLGYTMLLHFFSYDDKIKSDPNYSEDWASNPQIWTIKDFIPELFTDNKDMISDQNQTNKDEQYIDKLIENEINEYGIEHFADDSIADANFFTPIRIIFLLFILISIIVIRRMHGYDE